MFMHLCIIDDFRSYSYVTMANTETKQHAKVYLFVLADIPSANMLDSRRAHLQLLTVKIILL